MRYRTALGPHSSAPSSALHLLTNFLQPATHTEPEFTRWLPQTDTHRLTHVYTLPLQIVQYGSAPAVDMRVEVGLLSSNVRVIPVDGPSTHVRGIGEMFGARIVVAGNSSARISHAELRYGGQAMLRRPAVLFEVGGYCTNVLYLFNCLMMRR